MRNSQTLDIPNRFVLGLECATFRIAMIRRLLLIGVPLLLCTSELSAICSCRTAVSDEWLGIALICSESDTNASIAVFAFEDKSARMVFYDPLYTRIPPGITVVWKYQIGRQGSGIAFQAGTADTPPVLSGDYTHLPFLYALKRNDPIRFRLQSDSFGTPIRGTANHTLSNCKDNELVNEVDILIRDSEKRHLDEEAYHWVETIRRRLEGQM